MTDIIFAIYRGPVPIPPPTPIAVLLGRVA